MVGDTLRSKTRKGVIDNMRRDCANGDVTVGICEVAKGITRLMNVGLT